MSTDTPDFFIDLSLLFGAALLGGGLAQLLRQPLILGYLLGGILVGPFTPGPTISNPGSFHLFAEIGVVLLMFSIGLEFSLGELLRVRRVALVGAPLGMVLITALTVGFGHLLGWPLQQGLVVGAAVSVASTMVLSKFLIEKGELNSTHGRVIVGISLAEDLIVVALTVVIQGYSARDGGGAALLISSLARALLLLVPLLWLARIAMPRLLARVARTGNMELFLVVAMTVATGTAALTAWMGLSIALGAFLAGLVISESEFAHETLSRVLPVRDVFVAMFFVSMGTLIPPQSVVRDWPTVGALVAIVVVGAPLAWFAVTRTLGYGTVAAGLAALGLSQIGEFSYVLAAVGVRAGLVTQQVFQAVLATSVLTILANSLLFRRRPGWLTGVLRRHPDPAPPAPPDQDSLVGHVVICGFGRVGREVADALEHFDVRYVVVDIDPEVTALVRARGGMAVFGEGGHDPVLRGSGVEGARLAIVTIPDFDGAVKCVQALRRLRPDLPVLVRVHQGRYHALMALAGATTVIQPEIEAGHALVRHSLDHLGVNLDLGQQFIERKRAAPFPSENAGLTGTIVGSRTLVVSATRPTDGTLSIQALQVRTGASIVSVTRCDGEEIVDPAADLVLDPGDQAVAIGTSAQLNALVALCADPEQAT